MELSLRPSPFIEPVDTLLRELSWVGFFEYDLCGSQVDTLIANAEECLPGRPESTH